MTKTSSTFDGKYYQEVVKKTGNMGFFQSDRALYNTTAGQLSDASLYQCRNHWMAAAGEGRDTKKLWCGPCPHPECPSPTSPGWREAYISISVP